MLLLDTSFLVEFEDELAHERPGPATALLAARRKMPVAISIITVGEFAEGFLDPVALYEFLDPISCRTAFANDCLADGAIADVAVAPARGKRCVDRRNCADLRSNVGWSERALAVCLSLII